MDAFEAINNAIERILEYEKEFKITKKGDKKSDILFNLGASHGIYVALSTIRNDLLLWEHTEALKKIGLDKEVGQLFDYNDKIVTDEELEKKKKEQERLKVLEKKFND